MREDLPTRKGRGTYGKDGLDDKRVVLLQGLFVRLGERDRQFFGLVRLRTRERDLGELESAARCGGFGFAFSRRQHGAPRDEELAQEDHGGRSRGQRLTGGARGDPPLRCASSRPFRSRPAARAWSTVPALPRSGCEFSIPKEEQGRKSAAGVQSDASRGATDAMWGGGGASERGVSRRRSGQAPMEMGKPQRTVTLPFMSFWTTANEGFPSRSVMTRDTTAARSSRRQLAHAGGRVMRAAEDGPNILMSPSVAARNWSVSTPASWTCTSTNDCRRIRDKASAFPRALRRARCRRQGGRLLTLSTVSK